VLAPLTGDPKNAMGHEGVFYGVQGPAIFLAPHGSPQSFGQAIVAIVVDIDSVFFFGCRVDGAIVDSESAAAFHLSANNHG
jgi:hypothetical protein